MRDRLRRLRNSRCSVVLLSMLLVFVGGVFFTPAARILWMQHVETERDKAIQEIRLAVLDPAWECSRWEQLFREKFWAQCTEVIVYPSDWDEPRLKYQIEILLERHSIETAVSFFQMDPGPPRKIIDRIGKPP